MSKIELARELAFHSQRASYLAATGQYPHLLAAHQECAAFWLQQVKAAMTGDVRE